jgi:glyoxalase family protein
MQLTGIHHLTAITANARQNHDFYTRVLGMRLVKKTVNQDDTSAYHLFYGDGRATPGSDITFFDWPAAREKRGARAVTRTALRVDGEAALRFFDERFREFGVTRGEIAVIDGRATLPFEDFEGQRLALIDDGGAGQGHAWAKSPVAQNFQIRGLGPITLGVPELVPTAAVLTGVMNMRADRTYRDPAAPDHTVQVFVMGAGGPHAELHVAERPDLPEARQGAGGVHHVAFRTPDDAEYHAWNDRLKAMRVASSGPVDRFYFRSLYFREPSGILFEIATDGPGFDADEPMETLGEHLSLPPFLEDRRAAIEAGLKPIP